MSVIRKFVRTLANRKGKATCPECGASNPMGLDQEVITCSQCGFRGSVMEWSLRKLMPERTTPQADADHPPADTKITRKEPKPGTTAWEVPPSGRSGGMLAFAILWTGFITVWTSYAVFAASDSSDPDSILFPLFSIPFWAIGLGMLYFALRGKYAWHLILIDDRTVVLARSFFKRTTRKSLSRRALTSIDLKEFYQQNYTPVYGIEIRGREGKLRFGTTLTEEEKRWLVADLRRTVWPRGKEAEAAERASTITSPARPGRRAQAFAVDFPSSAGQGSIASFIPGFVVLGAFLAAGIFLMKDAGFFRWLWLGFNSLFLTALIVSTFLRVTRRNRHRRVRGDRSGLYIERLRGGQVQKSESVPDHQNVTVHSYPVGTQNDNAMVRIELVGSEHATTVLKWYPKDLAREPLAELQAALGQGAS